MREYKTNAHPKALADSIPVFCAFDKIVKTSSPKANPLNPNTHPEEQIKLLSEIIKATGWRAPITVSKQSGLVVKGHGRLLAAKLAELNEVPVDYQNYSSQEEETADLLADNKIAEFSKINKKQLLECFEQYDTGETPFILSGYTEAEYEEIAAMFDERDINSEKEKEKKDKSVVCPECGAVFVLGKGD